MRVVRPCVATDYRESGVCLAILHPLGSDRSGPIERLLALAGDGDREPPWKDGRIGPPETPGTHRPHIYSGRGWEAHTRMPPKRAAPPIRPSKIAKSEASTTASLGLEATTLIVR